MEMWVDTLQLIITTRHVQLTHSLPIGVDRTTVSTSMLTELNSSFDNDSSQSPARRPSMDTSASIRNSGTNTMYFSTTRHLDLLIRPKGWKLGDRLVLNARAFTTVWFHLDGVEYTMCC
jgi:hypothetical protein